MTNLQRLTGKIFGETATATGDDPQIGQFGSALNGTYVGTTDVATIQSLPAWSNGFIDSVTPNEQFPPLPEMTGFGKVLSYQTAYTLQKGVPEWDPGTTYYTGDFCKGVGEGKLYVSKIDSNINNDLTDTNSWEEFSSGNGYEVGDIIIRNTPTNDAGKHLLDGALIQYGSYQAFVDYIADLYNTSTNKYSNVTKIGSVVDTDGVLSGFSASNYAELPTVFNPENNPWETVYKVTTGNRVTGDVQVISIPTVDYTGFIVYLINDSKFHYGASTGGSSWNIINLTGTTTISTNTVYYIKFEFTGTSYNCYLSQDGESWTLDASASSTTVISSGALNLGNAKANAAVPFTGSIDLNESYININGQRWWDGRQTSGFVTEDEWQQSVTDYGVCGKFVYDSVNNTVRLPKVTGIIEGTTDLTALGDLIEAGLPNITGSIATDYANIVYADGVFTFPNTYKRALGGSMQNNIHYDISLDASRSSSIYGNSDTVQPQAIKVLYYIVIATVAKTAIQVDIDEIATDLNGKADVDLTNVNNSGTSRGAGWAMPSDTYVNLTLGASGTTYTSPANGWIAIEATATAAFGYVEMILPNNGLKTFDQRESTTNNRSLRLYMPISKGQTYLINYSNITLSYFRFIYAKGSESEAS